MGNDMNDADRKAFDAFVQQTGNIGDGAREAWQAACGWRDSQVGEPIGFLFQHEDTGLTDVVDPQQVEWGFEKNNPRWQKIGAVYLAPPTAQINQRLVDALQFVIDCQESTNGSDYQSGSALREAANMAKAALAATQMRGGA